MKFLDKKGELCAINGINERWKKPDNIIKAYYSAKKKTKTMRNPKVKTKKP